MSMLAETATLAHGFTMAEIDRYATLTARRLWTSGLDFEERYDSAWHAIVELIYASDTKPDWREIIFAARNAIQKATGDQMRHHGVDKLRGGLAPKFRRYWGVEEGSDRPGAMHTVRSAVAEDFTDRLVERMALPAALSTLTAEEYEVVATLAVQDSRRAAADALGLSEAQFAHRLQRARAKVMALWLAPETPRQMGGSRGSTAEQRAAGVCGNGHNRDEHSYRDSRDLVVCRLCKRNANRRRKASESNEQRDRRRAADRERATAKRRQRASGAGPAVIHESR